MTKVRHLRVSDMVLVMNKREDNAIRFTAKSYRQPASEFMASFMGMPTYSLRHWALIMLIYSNIVYQNQIHLIRLKQK